MEPFEQFWYGLAKKHLCEMISKYVHPSSRRSCLKLFFLFIACWPFFSTERNRLSNFNGLSPKEHSCIIISKSMNWFRRRKYLKVFLFLALAAILFNGAERFE